MSICVKWRGKIAETRKTCTHEYFAWKAIVPFTSNSLPSFVPSQFPWKIPNFLTQHIGLWTFLRILASKWSGETRSTCKHVHMSHLMKPKHGIHGYLSRSLAIHLIDEKFPVSLHNKSDFEYFDGYWVRLKGKFAETTPACTYESISQMPIVVFMRNISTRAFIHFRGEIVSFLRHTQYKGFRRFWWIFVHDGKEKCSEYGKTCTFLFFSLLTRLLLHWAPPACTARPGFSVHFFVLRFGHRHAHESVLEVAPNNNI